MTWLTCGKDISGTLVLATKPDRRTDRHEKLGNNLLYGSILVSTIFQMIPKPMIFDKFLTHMAY